MAFNIKLVMFDAVNTLLKVCPNSVIQYAKAAKDCGVIVSEEKLHDSYE